MLNFIFRELSMQLIIRWEDAKRTYLKFIDNEIITRLITRNPCTLRYTYSYTLIYTTRCTRGDARSFFCTYKTYLYAQN